MLFWRVTTASWFLHLLLCGSGPRPSKRLEGKAERVSFQRLPPHVMPTGHGGRTPDGMVDL